MVSEDYRRRSLSIWSVKTITVVELVSGFEHVDEGRDGTVLDRTTVHVAELCH